MEWIFRLFLLGMIDQGRRLVLWDDNRLAEAAAGMDAETHVVDMEGLDSLFSFFCLSDFA